MASGDQAKKIQSLLNRKRKIVKDEQPTTSKEANEDEKVTEKVEKSSEQLERERKAKDALLFEAKRARERADQYGPQGWMKPKSLATNKQFLQRTLKSTMFQPKKRKEE